MNICRFMLWCHIETRGGAGSNHSEEGSSWCCSCCPGCLSCRCLSRSCCCLNTAWISFFPFLQSSVKFRSWLHVYHSPKCPSPNGFKCPPSHCRGNMANIQDYYEMWPWRGAVAPTWPPLKRIFLFQTKCHVHTAWLCVGFSTTALKLHPLSCLHWVL